MRFEIAAAAALVAGASASYVPYNVSTPVYTSIYTPSVYYTTEVVSETTFFCPEATTIPYGTTTYTVSKPTTLVVPCSETYTTTYPVTSAVHTHPVVYSTAPASSAAPYYPSKNATVPVYTSPAGTGVASPTKSSPPAFTGAASKAGVGLAAVFGLAAYIL